MRSLPRVKYLWTSRTDQRVVHAHDRVSCTVTLLRRRRRQSGRRRDDDALAGVESGEHFDADRRRRRRS